MSLSYITDKAEKVDISVGIVLFTYYLHGGRYPVGSSQVFPDRLREAIERNGSSVRLRTPVSRILIERGRCHGVELKDGDIVLADTIISNADIKQTLLELVPPRNLSPSFVQGIQRIQASCSAFSVFLGVDFVPDIEPITFVLEEDIYPSIYIAMPLKIDSSLAPNGHSRITLTSFISHEEASNWKRDDADYRQRKSLFGEKLITKAERAIPELRKHIIFREEALPATFGRYVWTTEGAIYGSAVDQWKLPIKIPIEGLFLTGAGVTRRSGVEDAAISGTLAANMISPL